MRLRQREPGTSLHCPRRAFVALRRSVAWLESVVEEYCIEVLVAEAVKIA